MSGEVGAETEPGEIADETKAEERREKGYYVNTGVFWDVEDYPIPNIDGKTLYDRIIQALAFDFHRPGFPSFWFFGGTETDKPEIPEKFKPGYRDYMNIMEGVPQDKYERADRMITDMLFWAIDNHYKDYPDPLTLLVVSKTIPCDSELLYVLHRLLKNYKVILVLPEDDDAQVHKDIELLHGDIQFAPESLFLKIINAQCPECGQPLN